MSDNWVPYCPKQYRIPLFLSQLCKELGCEVLAKKMGLFTKKEWKQFIKILLDYDYYPDDPIRHCEFKIDFPSSMEE